MQQRGRKRIAVDVNSRQSRFIASQKLAISFASRETAVLQKHFRFHTHDLKRIFASDEEINVRMYGGRDGRAIIVRKRETEKESEPGSKISGFPLRLLPVRTTGMMPIFDSLHAYKWRFSIIMAD